MSDIMPFVSIVIGAYNEADNITICINNLKSQGYPDDKYEIIVVDNYSEDNTLQVVKDLNVKVVQEAQKGVTATRNRGIREAKGDILIFIDAHCFAQQGWLENIVRAFNDPQVGCVGGEIINSFSDTPLGRYIREKSYLSQKHTFKHPFLPYVEGGCIAIRKNVIDKIGPFDGNLPMGQDADFCWRMQLHTNYKVTIVPEAVVVHKQNITPKEIFRQRRRHGFAAVMLYKKHKAYWKPEKKSLKQLYWEYRSVLRRLLLLGIHNLREILGFKSGKPLPFNEHQFLFELGWKAGLIEGSIKKRVWFL